MHKFSLSKNIEGVLPQSILDQGGHAFSINADFRVILKIIRLFNDEEIADIHKMIIACNSFYKEDMPEDAVTLLMQFISGEDEQEEPPENNSAPTFCYEFDAPEIYASFMQQYGIDLLDVAFLHWYKFKALFSGLSQETPFMKKIQLRFMDLTHVKDKAKAQKAKAQVQLPSKISKAKTDYQTQIQMALKEGKDITELLKGDMNGE